MKFPSLFFAGLIFSSIPSFAQQDPGDRGGGRRERTPASQAPLPQVPLTPQQVEVIAKQLAELEKQSSGIRSVFIREALEKLRSKGGSEASALNFYQDCEKLVTMERKEMKREAIQAREEAMEKKNRRESELKEDIDPGHFATAVQLHIQYLVLTLEAAETPLKDRGPLMQKLYAYLKEVVAKSDKLKGRSGAQMNSTGGFIVNAMQLQGYLKAEEWADRPFSPLEIWKEAVFPYVKATAPESLSSQWDSLISAETAFQQGRLPAPEFEIWNQQDLPALRWERATYLCREGPDPVKGLAEMLNHIKAYPAHPESRSWLAAMQQAIEQAKPQAPAPPAAP